MPELFQRFYPGAEIDHPQPVDLLSGQPIRLVLGYDCTKPQVKDAIRIALGLDRLGFQVTCLIPHYASPKDAAEGPTPPQLKDRTWENRELAKACCDSRGCVNLPVYKEALPRLKSGTPLPKAVSDSYFAWAPQCLSFLQEFATTEPYQLVRTWERVKGFEHPWFRNGRDAMQFACSFGCIRREGAGRLTWAPLYKTAFGYRLTLARMTRSLCK